MLVFLVHNLKDARRRKKVDLGQKNKRTVLGKAIALFGGFVFHSSFIFPSTLFLF